MTGFPPDTLGFLADLGRWRDLAPLHRWLVAHVGCRLCRLPAARVDSAREHGRRVQPPTSAP